MKILIFLNTWGEGLSLTYQPTSSAKNQSSLALGVKVTFAYNSFCPRDLVFEVKMPSLSTGRKTEAKM